MLFSPDTNSICPIFFEKYGLSRLEQIGSGVILQLNSKIFLLTVAHITDYLEHGALFLPSNDGFTQIYGSYSSFKLPTGYKRTTDKVDIAYFKLSNSISESIHHSIKSLNRNDLHLTESLLENDIYTFSGFPISKAKSRGKQYTSEIFSFSGPAASITDYENNNYDKYINILVRFNRRNSCTSTGVKQMSPHPKGISGGAVFSWPKDIQTRQKDFEFHLVGIGHTYKENDNIFVGTRINVYLASIYGNNPDLINMPLNQVQQSNTIPLFAGIAWYKQEEWSRLKSEFDDSEKMHETWNEWRQATEGGLEHIARQNKIMYPILLEADHIKEYCLKHCLPNISQTRVRIVNEILASIIFEKEIK
jgi:hypothetical protein